MNFLGLLTPFTALTLYFAYTGHVVFAGAAFSAMVVLAFVEIVVSRIPPVPRRTSLPATAENAVRLFADQPEPRP